MIEWWNMVEWATMTNVKQYKLSGLVQLYRIGYNYNTILNQSYR